MTAAVIVSTRVDATRSRAFEAFTEEIGEWWRPNPLFVLTPRGDGHLRFEPGEGGITGITGTAYPFQYSAKSCHRNSKRKIGGIWRR
jgi:hypothetical protein